VSFMTRNGRHARTESSPGAGVRPEWVQRQSSDERAFPVSSDCRFETPA
jgi:hypothetical protein